MKYWNDDNNKTLHSLYICFGPKYYEIFCLHIFYLFFLAQPEQNSMTPEQGKPFKWSAEMMPDVIESRQRAFELKQDEEKSNGRKLSHNSLWEAEFKKIYPNSNFTSNNLSVHFWTWKKKQQKLAKKQGIPGNVYNSCQNLKFES